ncbi:hypothetical protein [Myroides pelagicus]|uniref:Uncharacterized protein n=1 Tax=Myroides pelagicus TaxID=270914 RepID=A0A7K1GP76_9FLAO|nr:hypothetical protein [Myroides pelagicus]MEC4113855.1 hypothetical protein [Myroides pelagicus]MTH30646.1 hypothetical protein [Myroides pelagicus]
MGKVAFDQKGFETKKKELFSLKTEDLQNELFKIVYCTKEWVMENFLLTQDQVVKLNDQPKDFLKQLRIAPTEFCYN